jgi:hypothetical protein
MSDAIEITDEELQRAIVDIVRSAGAAGMEGEEAERQFGIAEGILLDLKISAAIWAAWSNGLTRFRLSDDETDLIWLPAES